MNNIRYSNSRLYGHEYQKDLYVGKMLVSIAMNLYFLCQKPRIYFFILSTADPGELFKVTSHPNFTLF